ncbi:Uncharacterised protein [uncultured archaeon]|nr:Uncharacterised protein [uncultured archaeon]
MVCLEEVCKKNKLCFQINLLENIYCNLSLHRKVSCAYLEDKKDQNGLYPCKLTEENLKLVEKNVELTEGKILPTQEDIESSIN